MSSSDLRPIAAAVVSTGRVERPRPLAGESPPARPFVTVSRQAGAGGPAFGHALARRLRELDHGGRPWEAIDRELVERVVGEHHVPASLVRDFEDRSRTWLADLVEGLQFASNEPGELAVFHRVAHTIATFAREGRVVIIGRGSGFITRDLPGGVHVYLVAPLEWRVRRFAQTRGVSQDEAARAVREIAANRAAYYRRYWPDVPVAPESFTLTLNAAAAPMDDLVEAVAAVVMRHVAARGRSA